MERRFLAGLAMVGLIVHAVVLGCVALSRQVASQTQEQWVTGARLERGRAWVRYARVDTEVVTSAGATRRDAPEAERGDPRQDEPAEG